MQALDESAAGIGLRIVREEPVDDALLLWPDNVDAFCLFGRLKRQWVTGLAGPIALRLEALPVAMRACRLSDDDLPELMDALQIMESAALNLFEEHRQRST